LILWRLGIAVFAGEFVSNVWEDFFAQDQETMIRQAED